MSKKVWFITGANRGIGLALTESLLRAGHRVVATARHTGKLKTLTDTDNLLALTLNIISREQARSAVTEAVRHFGQIDVLVNNAGYGQLGWFEDAAEEEIRRQFEVNLFGTMNVTREVLPVMRKQKSGHIFTVSSTAGFNGVEGSSLYAASKFAVEGWMQGLNREVSPLGIKTTIVAPGGFRTDFLDESSVAHAKPSVSDYCDSVTAFTTMLNRFSHRQPGDPAKLGEVFISLSEMNEPPHRFAAGSDAYNGFIRKLDEYRQSAEALRELSFLTDFPDGQQSQERS
ncbi:TPA: SDR family NAD(P)-dependent oxidoreductase [Kluyvera ascorbata]|uniref:SDR family NAD(P)-dependent oxidoreductase n=1 Tax=Enterobacteriaceae TaxID=543 RepID=UPI00165EB682|nr:MULTISPECIES: SDR family NAD(P)-dependent oxidoreductase [Enterobacteriaceae]MCB3711906.1 SDR family NAD(P)-dependent oxidoreductase [Klebsiella pneumoniae]MEB8610314.1 SDR family NAD(P)-dependent oxidoreductase [Cronobacter sakazakii]WNU05725.1 SDR family NAD(P)-dependent oxidoreductase [Citrobacter freundii]HAT7516941.1 SDR family NAD(P)-dependent oxidoreductase [Kluyvera ascorbata]